MERHKLELLQILFKYIYTNYTMNMKKIKNQHDKNGIFHANNMIMIPYYPIIRRFFFF